MTKDNNLLGKFELAGIPPAPRGVPQIEVTVDADGILNVTAADSSTGKTNKITITNDKGRLSQEEIEKMVNDAEKYKAEDDKERARVDSKNKLESYIFQAKATLDEEKLKDKFTDDDRKAIKDKADEIMKWLEDNPSAEKDDLITIKKKWRRSSIPSFRRCTKQPVDRPEEQVECLDSQAPRVGLQVETQALVPVDPPSRKLTKQLIALQLLTMNSI